MRTRLVLGVLATLGVATTATAPAGSAPQAAAGSLGLRMTLSVVSDSVPCPPSLPQDETDCRARTGQAAVPGLGRVSERYTWLFRVGPPTCPANLAKPLATAGVFTVAGKGEIAFSLADGTSCVDLEPVRLQPQEFTITGGTGSFVGASGSGKVEPSVSGGAGTETWTGTLVVPGLEFDVTPPTLSGAKAKTVRAAKGAKTAKVTYKVTATDDVDGVVPASCQPRSGSRFKIGRTRVKCSATDSSANTASASFTVTVKARR